MPNNRIVPDVFASPQKSLGIEDTNLGKPLLPDRCPESKLAPCPESKAALDELHGALDRHIGFDSEQGMEVIRHNDEFVEAEFSLGAIVVQHADE